MQQLAGWSRETARAADLKVRNGVLEAQVKSCTARLAEVQAQLDFANREREKLNREKGDLQARNQMLSRYMEVQKQEVQRIRQEMNNEFKVLANGDIAGEIEEFFRDEPRTSRRNTQSLKSVWRD